MLEFRSMKDDIVSGAEAVKKMTDELLESYTIAATIQTRMRKGIL